MGMPTIDEVVNRLHRTNDARYHRWHTLLVAIEYQDYESVLRDLLKYTDDDDWKDSVLIVAKAIVQREQS